MGQTAGFVAGSWIVRQSPRKSYKLAMEEVLGAIDVLRPVGEFMVWRSEIAPVTQP